MSASVYYNFKIADPSISKELRSQQVAFDNKKALKRNVKSGDGDVSVTLTGLGTIAALLVITDLDISLKIDGNTIPVSSFYFSELSELTSLAIACADTDGAEVEVTVWGAD